MGPVGPVELIIIAALPPPVVVPKSSDTSSVSVAPDFMEATYARSVLFSLNVTAPKISPFVSEVGPVA